MRCPACSSKLTEIQARGVPVDVCKGGCGGVWFDTFEFRRFDEPHEFAGLDLLEVERNASVHVDYSERRLCPRCDGMPMVRHFYSAKKLVQIDECNGCGGVWLDAGELKKIRSLFKSGKERRQFKKQAFNRILGFGLSVLEGERHQHLLKRRRLAMKTRYLCPSHFSRENQEWGAF